MGYLFKACLAVGLSASLLCGCGRGYAVYQFDNGDDYVSEGVRRVVDGRGRIGFADESGRVAVEPRFAFAFPFSDGVAKVSDSGRMVSDGEHSRWESDSWYYVDHSGNRVSALEERLRECVGGIDARVGVAVIIDGRDTVAVHGGERFPMLSVYKFPQALAVARHCMERGMSFADSLDISASEMKTDTWSPMREKYGVRDLRLALMELLAYTLQQSDNNACDVLFRFIGGPAVADSLMRSEGFADIRIVSTEDEMHADPRLCYDNYSTPLAMAALFDRFNREMRCASAEYATIARLAETCATGTDRLARGLAASGWTLGHKTGTGDTDSLGRIMAVNDAGYVNLSGGRRCAVAVFVSDAACTMAEASALIARISSIVYDSIAQ